MVPVVIIGAGASGMMAAIAASRVRPHSVLLLEKEARVGRKLLATGNGRCNLLNMRVAEGCYHGSGAAVAIQMLASMQPQKQIDYFAELGLACREEATGRVYPFSGSANAVLDVLRNACTRLGVKERTDAVVQSIQHTGSMFRIKLQGGEMITAKRVILAAGGKASPSLGSNGSGYALLESLGHTILPTFPAIVPLKLPPDRIKGLKGIRVQAEVTLCGDSKPMQTEQGELLFTDYGVSGIAAMQLARLVQAGKSRGASTVLSVKLMEPEMAEREVWARLVRMKDEPMEGFFTGLLHKRIGLCLLREANLTGQSPITEDTVKRLVNLLSDWRLPVQGTMAFPQAQVTAGGAWMDEFEPETLASKRVPGLYACGEVLDVDGDCGGYNLMWAWVSGIAAGTAAAGSVDR